MSVNTEEVKERTEDEDLDESWREEVRNRAQGAGGCAEFMDALSELREGDDGS